MRRLLASGVLLVLGVCVLFFGTPGVAEAAIPGRATWQGYFFNRQDTAGQDLFDGGIGARNIDAFVDFYLTRVNSADPTLNAPAAFTILSMLGAPAGTPWTDARTRFAEWESTVRWYDANGRIGWNVPYFFTTNTYLQDDVPSDVAWYNNSANLPSIVFTSPNGTTYAIKIDCANPVGEMSALQLPPPPPPPLEVSCGTSAVLPGRSTEVGAPVTVTATITYTGTGGATTFTPSNATITVSGPGGTTTRPATVSPASSGSSPGTFTLRITNYVPARPGQYVIAWSAAVNGVLPNPAPCGGVPVAPDNVFTVLNHPFLQVTGGDVAAGASFQNNASQPCGAHNPSAGIVSWNSDAAPYNGAGTEYGAFAMSLIQGFVTAQGNTAGRQPWSLSFANTANTGSGNYGGFFGSGPCVDYWSKKPASGPAFSGSFVTNTYVNTGNLVINGGTVNAGEHVTIYVDGDVLIRGDIAYGGSGSWNTKADIPSLRIIAKGVIHIAENVRSLDGTYVAVPDAATINAPNTFAAPNDGTISTCSKRASFAVNDPSASPAATIVNCGAVPLTVNGSLIANHIFFLRTLGTVNAGNPAETINYGPENWLVPAGGSMLTPGYQSIQSLPPVL